MTGSPELAELVHRNLHATLDLAEVDLTTETVHSRRQDQYYSSFPLGPYLAQFARFATGCDRCRAATAWVADADWIDAVDVLMQSRLDEVVRDGIIAAEGVQRQDLAWAAIGEGTRLFAGPRMWRRRGKAGSTLLFAGSDVPSAGRVSSGLACNPTFARFRRAGIAVTSLRLSREFFSMGPFRPTSLDESGDIVTLGEVLRASYYQPIAEWSADGVYALEHEGRFSSAMRFSARTRDDLTLATEVRVRLTPGSIRLEIETTGPVVPHALEIALDDDVTPVGVEPADMPGAFRWCPGAVLRAADGTRMAVMVTPEPVSTVRAAYSPGEAYTFVGGTDALGGRRLYVTWESPGTQAIEFSLDG